LARAPGWRYDARVQPFIRFVGLVNIAVWFGAAVFFTVAAGPAFFSAEMLGFLPKPYAGRAAEVIIERYLLLQQWCGAIALLHVLVEYLYSGRQTERWSLGLLSALFVLALMGSYWLQPHMHELQRTMYATTSTVVQQAAARSRFGLLHGASSVVNLLMICGLLYYLWKLTRAVQPLRFGGADKFRS
jgi:hypothetical protein